MFTVNETSLFFFNCTSLPKLIYERDDQPDVQGIGEMHKYQLWNLYEDISSKSVSWLGRAPQAQL